MSTAHNDVHLLEPGMHLGFPMTSANADDLPWAAPERSTVASITSNLQDASSDIVVVGAGLSGLTAAYSAVQANPGKQVLLLEAGPKGPLKHVDARPSGELGFARWSGHETDPFSKGTRELAETFQGVTRQVIGGRGLYWHGVLVPIDPAEFKDDVRASDWLKELNFSDPGDGYAKVRNELRQIGFFQQGGRAIPMLTSGSLLQAADMAISETSGEPFSPTKYFDWKYEGWSGDNSVTVATEITARSIRKISDVWNVQCTKTNNGQTILVRTPSLILASGVLANCRLLESYFQTGLPYSFTDHLDVGAVCRIPADSAAYAALIEYAGKRFMLSRSGTAGYNLFITFVQRRNALIAIAWATGEKDLLSVLGARVRANDTCLIEGTKSEIDHLKEVAMGKAVGSMLEEVIYSTGERNKAQFSTRSLETKQAIRNILYGSVPDWSALTYVSELGSSDHEACLSSTQLRLDSLGRVCGEEQLYVAGPAALKRMGSANPSLSVLAMAFRVGEALALT